MKKRFFFAALIVFPLSVLLVMGCRPNKEDIRPFTMPRATPPSITNKERQCKAVNKDKKRCPTTTRFTNGYCALHQALYNDSTAVIP